MWRTTFFLPLILILIYNPCFSEQRTNRGVWNRIEVGTNLIPLIDSSTLKFDNLMLKYYYDASHSKAFRLNWKYSNTTLDFFNNDSVFYKAKYRFEAGHLWQYNIKEKVDFYQAVDFGYDHFAARTFSSHYPIEPRRNVNEFGLAYSLGIKYSLGNGFSLSIETSLRALLWIYYDNYGRQYGYNGMPPQIFDRYIYFTFINYYPIKYLTINYKF